jgi:hypothetical protein
MGSLAVSLAVSLTVSSTRRASKLLLLLALSGRASTVTAGDLPALNAKKGLGHSRKDAALVIAVEDYASIPDAYAAGADADAFTGFLTGNADLPSSNVLRLTNASAADIRNGLVGIRSKVKKNGTIWVYFAGHGGVASDGGRIVLPADVAPEFGAVTGVALADLMNVAVGTRAARAVVVVDAGFGGIGRSGEELFPGNRFTVLGPLPTPKEPTFALWTSTTTAEASALYAAAGHSMFTYFAVGALGGWADGAIGTPADGVVTLGEAQAWVAKQVRAVGGPSQKPLKEPREALLDWKLSSRNLEDGPSRADLNAMAEAESARRITAATEGALAEATAVWAQLPEGAAREPALRGFVSRYDAASIVVDGVEVPVLAPEVAVARTELDALARAAAARTGRKRRSSRTKKAVVVVTQAVSTSACDDLVRLEPASMIGQLSNDDVSCLETRIAQDPSQTQRDKVSRVLMVNAEGRGDMAEWMTLAARHLEVIDRSDPDLCFRYALLLARGEVEDAEVALRWADYALENKHIWQGPAYKQRVYALLGLRADLAGRLWLDAEQTYIEDRSDDAEAIASRWRGGAKDFSREWLDYARVTGQSTTQPGVLCRSAAGNDGFCSEVHVDPAATPDPLRPVQP